MDWGKPKGEEMVMRRQAVEMTNKAYHYSPKRSAKSKLKKAINKVVMAINQVPRKATEGI